MKYEAAGWGRRDGTWRVDRESLTTPYRVASALAIQNGAKSSLRAIMGAYGRHANLSESYWTDGLIDACAGAFPILATFQLESDRASTGATIARCAPLTDVIIPLRLWGAKAAVGEVALDAFSLTRDDFLWHVCLTQRTGTLSFLALPTDATFSSSEKLLAYVAEEQAYAILGGEA